jgi:uncharacterized protein YfaP (DUF2135 family)
MSMKWQRLISLLVISLAVVMATAAQEGSIDIGTPVHGEASSQRAEYLLTLKADQTVSIVMESDEFDTYLELYDDDGNLLDSNDDSDGTNSRLIFTAPADGTYQILARSYGSDLAEGAYMLLVEALDVVGQLDGGRLEYDEPVTVEGSGALSVAFTFKGSSGDVVDIIALDEAEDTKMVLQGPDGSDLIEDDDSGTGSSPALLRYELPESGTYTVLVTPFAEVTPLAGTIEMVVRSSSLLILNEGAQEVTLGADRDQDVVHLDVRAGTDYLITVTSPVSLDTSLYLNALNPNEQYGMTSITAYGTRSVSFIFQPSQTGRAAVTVEVYSFGSVYELTVEARALE